MRAVNCKSFLGIIIFLMAIGFLMANEPSLEEFPGLSERAVTIRIISSIVEEDELVVWNTENITATIPGQPVALKLVGPNIVISVQFTPFLRPRGRHMLLAQGQIWMEIPNEGMFYHNTMQTIPFNFREQVYFFPLGSANPGSEARIEIEIIIEPYTRTSPPVRIDR